MEKKEGGGGDKRRGVRKTRKTEGETNKEKEEIDGNSDGGRG